MTSTHAGQALFDWRLAHEKIDEFYDDKIAGESRRILSTLVGNADEIKNVTDRGIKTLVQLHVDTNTVQLEAKTPGRRREVNTCFSTRLKS